MESLGVVTINGVQSKDAGGVWPLVEGWIQSACDVAPELMSSDTVLRDVQSQEQQLWVIQIGDYVAGAFTTRVAIHPTGVKTLVVVTLGGVFMKKWLPDLIALLREFGKAHDCAFVEAHGRRGWAKTLREFGWQEMAVSVALEI